MQFYFGAIVPVQNFRPEKNEYAGRESEAKWYEISLEAGAQHTVDDTDVKLASECGVSIQEWIVDDTGVRLASECEVGMQKGIRQEGWDAFT